MNLAPYLILVAISLTASACASKAHDDVVAHPVTHPEDELHTKPRAPLELDLTVDAPTGPAEVTLAIRATARVPRATARFVLPDGVHLVDGKPEQELGALAAGEERRVTIRVGIAADIVANIAAGVDCHLTDTVVLHAGRVVAIGSRTPDPGDPGRVTPDGVWLTPTLPK